MKVTLCHTNTLILPAIVNITHTHTQFLPPTEKTKSKWDYQSKIIPWGGLLKF